MKNRPPLSFLAVIIGMGLLAGSPRLGFGSLNSPMKVDAWTSLNLLAPSFESPSAAVTRHFLQYGNRAGFSFGYIRSGWASTLLRVRGTPPGSDGRATTIEIPILGKLDVQGYSLLVLAVLLGLIDGFNPCAMWALVYLISVVVSLNDKWKIWLIVGTFVLSSGVWYFLFMSAWLNVFLFFGYLRPITLAIGFVAIFVGIRGLYDLIKNRGAPVCTVVDDRSKEKTMNRMKRILLSPVSIGSVVSIIGLSFIVNSIEFVCSCAIPAVFTHMLSISRLTWVEHYGYILLYIFFFMLDDLIIFGSAAFAFNALVGNRYIVYCKLLGGVLLIGLGYLLIFKPYVLLIG